MVWLVARRRARRESVSIWIGASSTLFFLDFISSGIAEQVTDFHGNKGRMIVAFPSLEPTESQPRPPSISHFLLFLAIKSYFLSVVFAHDASVMLMKSQ